MVLFEVIGEMEVSRLKLPANENDLGIQSRVVVAEAGIGEMLEPISDLRGEANIQSDSNVTGELERAPEIPTADPVASDKCRRRAANQGYWQVIVSESEGRSERTDGCVVIAVADPTRRAGGKS